MTDPARDVKELRRALVERLRELGSVLVALSGGVDSTVLMAAAHEALGEKAVALTASCPAFLEEEVQQARERARALGVRHLVEEAPLLSLAGFVENSPDRCYHCKGKILELAFERAGELGLAAVLDGTNRDDRGDFRPGMRAARERGVVQPFLELDMGKEEIRALGRAMELPNWNQPSMACLASRFPYGTTITEEGLQRVARAEESLRELGFPELRVRSHHPVARIEVPLSSLGRLIEEETREQVVEQVKAAGFTYVSMDLEGLRSGSMNATLSRRVREG